MFWVSRTWTDADCACDTTRGKKDPMVDRERLVTNIRILCAEMVEGPQSGHAGSPLGLAPFLLELYSVLNFDPANPRNPDRDVFILSNAHACAVQYVFNHLIGYLSMEDLKGFRRIHSNTPGHPEKNDKGIEITSEPLGQGVAEAVGFAIALKKSGCSGKVFCVFGDGCYQEGISQEAFSIAAHLNLNNLVYIYDSNKMTIDGATSLSMTEDPRQRFAALGFEVLELDGDAYSEEWRTAFEQCERVRMVILHTVIGKGCIYEGENRMHGSPMGKEAIDLMKSRVGITHEFEVLPELYNYFEDIKRSRRRKSATTMRAEIKLDIDFAAYVPEDRAIATRIHFANALNELPEFELLVGGAADLTQSVGTKRSTFTEITADTPRGNYIRYGIREHAMCAIMNGLAAYGFWPFGGTFLNFVTYCFPAIRLAALDNAKVFYVLTHDSVGVGEDGPTHQPIEALALLRATPNIHVLRPCDGVETRFSLKYALERNGPTCIVLSRQGIEPVAGTSMDGAARGAYFIMRNAEPDVTIIATGSEVPLGVKVAETLAGRGIAASLVSLVSFEIFDAQDSTYREDVLGSGPRVSIEALSTFGWERYSHLQIGMTTFGASGRAADVFDHFGFTPEKVASKVEIFLQLRERAR